LAATREQNQGAEYDWSMVMSWFGAAPRA
jgi:hypothetical protein